MNGLELEEDPFADAIESYYETGRGSFRYTREDGWSQVEDAWWYFTGYRDFPLVEKRALRDIRGRVLDVGCGAGRHSLFLQRKGFAVTGLEASLRIATIAQKRGLNDVRIASACGKLPFEDGQFDTAMLFGNNLGICGSFRGTRGLLRELARVTSKQGRILATTRGPDLGTAKHLEYWKTQLGRGRRLGEMQLRVCFRDGKEKAVDLCLFSPGDILRLGHTAGWQVSRFLIHGPIERGYGVVLDKLARRIQSTLT